MYKMEDGATIKAAELKIYLVGSIYTSGIKQGLVC